MNYSKKICQENNHYWLCAVLLLIISFPHWFWNMGAGVITVASYLLLFVAYDDIYRNGKKVGLLALFFEIIIIGITRIFFDTNINGYLMVLISGIGFATLFLCSAEFWKNTVDKFIKLLAILLIPALIEHILLSFWGFELVPSQLGQCPTNPGRNYLFFYFNAYIESLFGYFNRFSAFYDEPGVLGNILMVMLYIQKFDMKKWYNIVLLISGFLSFSLTFYIAFAAYFILFGGVKMKVIFLVFIFAAIYYFYNNEYIYFYIFGRLEFDNGQLAGYNREISGNFQYWIKTIPVTDYLIWGYRPRDVVPYAASWKWAFALYGIVPSLIYLFTIIYYRAKRIANVRDILAGLVLLVIIWIQRPFVYLYLYVFLIIIPFIYYSSYMKYSHLMNNKGRASKSVIDSYYYPMGENYLA